jgi:hypothetical protein
MLTKLRASICAEFTEVKSVVLMVTIAAADMSRQTAGALSVSLYVEKSQAVRHDPYWWAGSYLKAFQKAPHRVGRYQVSEQAMKLGAERGKRTGQACLNGV